MRRKQFMEEFKDLGKLLSDAIIFINIYSAIIFAVLISLIVLCIRYIKQKKNSRDKDNVKKKYVPLSISIIIVTAVLILLLAPIIMVVFL